MHLSTIFSVKNQLLVGVVSFMPCSSKFKRLPTRTFLKVTQWPRSSHYSSGRHLIILLTAQEERCTTTHTAVYSAIILKNDMDYTSVRARRNLGASGGKRKSVWPEVAGFGFHRNLSPASGQHPFPRPTPWSLRKHAWVLERGSARVFEAKASTLMRFTPVAFSKGYELKAPGFLFTAWHVQRTHVKKRQRKLLAVFSP